MKKGVSQVRKNLFIVTFFLLISLGYFYDMLTGRFLLTERDLSVFFIPPRMLWVGLVKGGEFPLWNPYYFSGHPLLATLQPGIFYPLNLLFFLLPFVIAFNYIIILHYFLTGTFTFFLALWLGTSRSGAVITAIVFMLSGYLLSVHNVLSTFLSVTWVPLSMLLFLKARRKESPWYAVLTGIVLTVMFFGGGIETVYATFGLLFLLTLYPDTLIDDTEGIVRSSLRQRFVLFLILSVVFLGLSSIQIIPFLELASNSIRSGGLSYGEATTWSFELKDIIQFFIPDPYGYGMSEEKYWTNQSWLKTVYLGVIPFILSIFFFLDKGRKRLFVILIILISLALSMGRNTAIYPYLYEYLPFFDKIRYPVKFLFLLVLFLSITSGLGYDSLIKGLAAKDIRTKNTILILFGITVAASFIFGGLYLFDHEIRATIELRGFVPPDYNELSINLHNTKRLLFFVILSGLSLLLFLRVPKIRGIQPYIIIFILTVDLFFAHRGFYHKTETELYHRESESVSFLSQDDEIFRFFVTPKTKKEGAVIYIADSVERLTTLLEEGDYLKRLAVEKEKVTNYNLDSRLFDVEGTDVMSLKGYSNILSLLATATGPDVTNLMPLLNVKYLISIPPVDSEEFRLVKTILTETSVPLEDIEDKNVIKIYENLNYLPRAFLVENYRIMTEEDDYYKTLQEKEFVPANEVLLY
ncbi:MAG: hypothetical protein ACE5IH_03150, partial [Thermodesulfobacteriota bacterium]